MKNMMHNNEKDKYKKEKWQVKWKTFIYRTKKPFQKFQVFTPLFANQ